VFYSDRSSFEWSSITTLAELELSNTGIVVLVVVVVVVVMVTFRVSLLHLSQYSKNNISTRLTYPS